MSFGDSHYPVPIDAKPTVLEVGLGLHGEGPEVFRHDGYWSLQLCYDPAELTIGDEKLTLIPGSAVIRPPYQLLRYEYLCNPWRGCYVHFVAHPLASDPVTIPVVQDAGDIFHDLCAALIDAHTLLDSSPLQAEIRVWDTLWRVARLAKHNDPTPIHVHPAVKRAVDFVDVSTPNTFELNQVILASGVSHTHLNRLFHGELGTSVSEHIRKRKAQRAKQLLHFTNMPIRVVAQEIGMADLQQFNKFVRSEFGVSPREFRSIAYMSRQVNKTDARLTDTKIG